MWIVSAKVLQQLCALSGETLDMSESFRINMHRYTSLLAMPRLILQLQENEGPV